MLFGERSGPQRGPLLLLALVLASLVPSNCHAAAGSKTDYLLSKAIQSNTAKDTQTAKPTQSITEADATECVDMFWPANAAPNLRRSLIKHTAERMRSSGMNKLPTNSTTQVPVEMLSQGASKKRKNKPAKRPQDQPYSTPSSNYEGPAPHHPYEGPDKTPYDGPGPKPYDGPGPSPNKYDSPSSFPYLYRGRGYRDDYPGPRQEPYGQDDYPGPRQEPYGQDDYPGPRQEPYGQDDPRRSKSGGAQICQGGKSISIDNSLAGGQNGRLIGQSSMPGVTLSGSYWARGGDDGIYGDWDAKGDLERELVPTDDRPFFTVTGPEDPFCTHPWAPAPAPTAAAAFAVGEEPRVHPCDLSRTRMTIWGKFYDLKGATSILGQGYYPPSVTYDLRPTTCFYTSPSGDFYEGDVVNVTPNREATLDELADGSWSAGLTLKIVCDNFRVQYAGKATLDVPYVSQAKASACVDMLWPNAPNHVRRARIRQAMTSKAADQPTAPFMPTQIARFQPYSRQYQNGPTPRTYIGEVISELQLMMMYGGFKTDTGVLDATKTGAYLVHNFGAQILSEDDKSFDQTQPESLGRVNGHQSTPVVPLRGDGPFARVEGQASYPERIVLSGKLSGQRSGIPDNIQMPAGIEQALQAYTDIDVYGYVADNLTFDVSKWINPECVYRNPCGDDLYGSLRVAPNLGRHSLAELVNWEWLPKSEVEFVCTIPKGQQTDC